MYKQLLTAFLFTLTSIYANTFKNSFEQLTVEGYLRSGYEIHNVQNNKTFRDGALGGKVHIETASYYGLSFGSSFYSSNALGSSDNRGLVPFRGEVAHSYAILGEVYVNLKKGNSLLKIGRQEIETPFVQMDDIGIVPNTFEAYVFENRDLFHTTFFLGQIQKMAGVDANKVDTFTKINKDNNMQVLGISYDGFKNIELNMWLHYLKDAQINKISYLEAIYQVQSNTLEYGIGLQWSEQKYPDEKDAYIYGISGNIKHLKSGFGLFSAYNKADGNAVTSGFGGGAFFSSSEYLIIDNSGENGSQLLLKLEFDASSIGIESLNIGISKAVLTNKLKEKATELDFVASYDITPELKINTVYSNLKGKKIGEDRAKHFRAFVNYLF